MEHAQASVLNEIGLGSMAMDLLLGPITSNTVRLILRSPCMEINTDTTDFNRSARILIQSDGHYTYQTKVGLIAIGSTEFVLEENYWEVGI